MELYDLYYHLSTKINGTISSNFNVPAASLTVKYYSHTRNDLLRKQSERHRELLHDSAHQAGFEPALYLSIVPCKTGRCADDMFISIELTDSSNNIHKTLRVLFTVVRTFPQALDALIVKF